MIDTVIKAELPTAEENLSLRETVLKYKMDHSDHLAYPTNRCYKDGKCLNGFPKPLQQTTTIDESGRVIYRRCKEEDRMIVLYMPFLTELMDCHVNVDMTFTVNIFMYLYKYLFKEPDNTSYMITDPNQQHTDQIKDFVNAHYVRASEAPWRIFGFEISRKHPAVAFLTVYLPGENFHQMPRKNGTASTTSKLLRYCAHPTATQFLLPRYTEFYNTYIHKLLAEASNCNLNQRLERPSPDINIPQIISARVGGEIFFRSTFISPPTGEDFYLRALLLRKTA